MVRAAARIARDRLQLVDVQRLLSAGSDLDLMPLEEAQRCQVAEHSLHASTNLSDLLLVLILSCLDYLFDIVFDVLNSDEFR